MSKATDHLRGACAILAAHIIRTGPLKPRPRVFHDLYPALLSAVAHQQLHARAATTILGRLQALSPTNDLPDPATLLALPDATIRACGFSANKTRALQDIAAKALDGTIPTSAAAKRLSDSDLITRLTTIRGVGQWTVEMLLIFTLNRPDILPIDDFGVREGYRLLHNLPTQPKPKALATLATPYAPHRTTAALYLWHAADMAKSGLK
jgi:DNA-3-methyladenine glycosylase II